MPRTRWPGVSKDLPDVQRLLQQSGGQPTAVLDADGWFQTGEILARVDDERFLLHGFDHQEGVCRRQAARTLCIHTRRSRRRCDERLWPWRNAQ